MFHFLRQRTRPPIASDRAALASLTHDLESVLSTLYSPPGRPPACDWARAALASHGVPTATTASRSRSLRLTGGLAAGLAAVVLTAAGYAAVAGTGLADRMFANFGGTPAQEGSHPIGVSKTFDGITVTVDHAVFDGAPVEEPSGPGGALVEYVPVMVQFTVSGLPDDEWSPYSVTESLRSGGLELRRVGGVGLRGYSDVLDRDLPPGTQQMLFAYDTTGLALGSGNLPLELEVTVTPRGDQNSHASEPPPGSVIPLDMPSGLPIRFVLTFSVPTR